MMSRNQPAPGKAPENLIHLWKTGDGRRCTLTKEASGPPFEVTIYLRAQALQLRTFTTHNQAAEFAIRELSADLPISAASTPSNRPTPYSA